MNYRQIYARKAEWKTLKNEMEAKEDCKYENWID